MTIIPETKKGREINKYSLERKSKYYFQQTSQLSVDKTLPSTTEVLSCTAIMKMRLSETRVSLAIKLTFISERHELTLLLVADLSQKSLLLKS